MSFSNKPQERPAGLFSIPENEGKTVEWYYKAPSTGDLVHVATFKLETQELILTCNGYQSTMVTTRCVTWVFKDLMGAKFTSCFREKGAIKVNGVKIPFNTPIRIFNKSEIQV